MILLIWVSKNKVIIDKKELNIKALAHKSIVMPIMIKQSYMDLKDSIRKEMSLTKKIKKQSWVVYILIQNIHQELTVEICLEVRYIHLIVSFKPQ